MINLFIYNNLEGLCTDSFNLISNGYYHIDTITDFDINITTKRFYWLNRLKINDISSSIIPFKDLIHKFYVISII